MLDLDADVAARGGSAAPATLRVARLYGLGRALLGAGRLERAAERAGEAVHLAERTGDADGRANGYATIGMIAQAAGRLDDAEAAYIASHTCARMAGRADIEHQARYWLGELARLRGDDARAVALFEEALAGARAAASTWDVAVIATHLGHLARERGRYDEARARYNEGLALFRGFASPTWTAWCLEGLAATLGAEGRHSRAARLCAAAALLRARARSPLPPAERPVFQATVAAARAALGDAVFLAEWSAGSAGAADGVIADPLDVAAGPNGEDVQADAGSPIRRRADARRARLSGGP
jgi:tetratricopeptide (TPR) repeat protein